MFLTKIIIMEIQKVGKFKLIHQGGYVCRAEFIYVDSNDKLQHSSQTSYEILGQSYVIDPGDLNVPDGSVIRIKILVKLGLDNQAAETFIYQSGNQNVAEYSCSGVAFNNRLILVDVN